MRIHAVSVQIVWVNCTGCTCLRVWSALCYSSTELSNKCFHKGFKWTSGRCCQRKPGGKPRRTPEITLRRLPNRSKNGKNKNCFHHILKASLSVITSNIKTVPTQLKYISIKKPISLTAKIVIFPVFWRCGSKTNKSVVLWQKCFTFYWIKSDLKTLYCRERISAVEYGEYGKYTFYCMICFEMKTSILTVFSCS